MGEGGGGGGGGDISRYSAVVTNSYIRRSGLEEAQLIKVSGVPEVDSCRAQMSLKRNIQSHSYNLSIKCKLRSIKTAMNILVYIYHR